MTIPATTQLHEAIERHWGIRALRPLQEPAINAVLSKNDSLVVLPTGGGKSLCYQAPAVLSKETTVVISPLISLMKDQVDGLRASGVSAAQIDSSLTLDERRSIEGQLRQGGLKLLFLAPERLVMPEMITLLKEIGVRTFAIDEAHCISHWGHDFRPEYRQLKRLRDHFKGVSIHAYTATATERVRRDIIEQLGLKSPEVLVGNFDRSNLTYRVRHRRDTMSQIGEIIARHRGEGGIIYCIRRADVDRLTEALVKQGIKAMPYHAGLTSGERTATQEAFVDERCDVVVATVAFGMGIDRSNVRYVVHAAMPKSIEHYQQETGRAGRDGLEAECVLLHSGSDFFSWKSLVERANGESEVDPLYVESAISHISEMNRFCRAAACRHKLLVEYFGQAYEKEDCGSCDLCLGETLIVKDATVVAQKIISCVARVKERYGIGHVVSVLRGERTEAIRQRGHEELSTYGLLKDSSVHDVRDWVYQLISQGALSLEEIETSFGRNVSIVRLNKNSWEIMRGQKEAKLLQPAQVKKGQGMKGSRSESESWEGVDRDLFEKMRALRRRLAGERGVPPYIVFPDSTLREIARACPSNLSLFRQISGVGDAKLRDYGEQFLELINDHLGSA